MSTPFLGEVKICSFSFPPKGWALCNGQLLPINQNQALFSLLGTTYGGNGQTNFALPNLQGRAPLHFGNGIVQGQVAGEANHTLIISELPAHNHIPQGSTATPNQGSPGNNYWAALAGSYSTTSPDNAMNPGSISSVGGSQPHNNLQPYLVLNFIIALQGIFPSRN
ncbi:tail fiber protein [Tabrizicola sp.]|uniref:phage tail protein n=1 Tax=Tabrizicola sp. TaxID=2005166 RepID=UPI00286BA936|nr:tail fiber protein [Tabrizicola sp.]